MKKSNLYAKNGAILIGIGNGIFNAFRQFERMTEDPTIKFDWLELLKAIGKGAAFGGVAGYGIGAFLDYQNSKEVPIDLNNHFDVLVGAIVLDRSDPQYLRLQRKVNVLIRSFKKYFGSYLNGDLIFHGSTERGTALHDSYDIDIAIPFKPKSFANTAEMYEDVYSFFESRKSELAITKVRRQTRSIGVYIEINQRSHRIDFAPYKLSRSRESSGYLFVNRKGVLVDESTIQKTDIEKLKRKKLSNTQKKIVIILKDWKSRKSLPLPSHLLESLVLEAYDFNRGRLPKDLSKKIVMVLNHIAENLHFSYIRGVENTNNVLTKNLSDFDKKLIVDACSKAVQDYEYQPNSLAKVLG